MVGAGLEPATLVLSERCSNQLSYPTKGLTTMTNLHLPALNGKARRGNKLSPYFSIIRSIHDYYRMTSYLWEVSIFRLIVMSDPFYL